MKSEKDLDEFLALLRSDMMNDINKGGYSNIKVMDTNEKLVTSSSIEGLTEIIDGRNKRAYTITTFL